MSTYYTIVTNNGKQQFATAAQTTAKVNITHLALGDGNGNTPTPSATRTALVKEKVRVAVNKVEIHATNHNWIEIHAIIPSTSGGYTVRELALYAGTTLIAIGSFPATYKPTATEGGAREMSIKLIIAVEDASVVNVTLDNSLVYATQKWVEDNFVNHNEVINTLTATDTDKPLSAAQGKALQDTKANQATAITAGNGLTGGGTLQASRTLTLGTPSQITASTTNSVTATSHTHAIDKASTTVSGVVQLNDTLASTATDQALTANQGKVLNDKITTANADIATKANQATTITAGNGLTGGGTLQANRTLTLGTPSQITASSTNSVTATSHTHAIDKASTTVAGVVQLVDNLTTDDATKALTAAQGKALNDKLTATDAKADTKVNRAGDVMTGHLQLRYVNDWVGYSANNPTEGKNGYYDVAINNIARGGMQVVSRGNGRYDTIIGITPTGATNTERRVGGLTVSEDGLHAHAYGALHEYFARMVHRHNWNEIDGKPSTFTPSSHTHTWSQIMGVPSSSTSTAGIVQLVDNLTTDDATKALTAAQGKALNDKLTATDAKADTKVNRAGDVMTGHLQLRYVNDWVGYSANNPTEGKNGYYDVAINNIARGGMQVVSRGNGRYDTIIGITPTGATNTERRVGGLAVSEDGLHAHAYGALHEYFARMSDFANSKTENGYQKLPNGLIIQWGKYPATSYLGERSVSITFPIAFPSQCLNVSATMHMVRHGPAGDGGVLVTSITETGAEMSVQVFNSLSIQYLRGFSWLAIGY